MRVRSIPTTYSLILVLAISVLLPSLGFPLHGQTLTTLWSFGSSKRRRGPDGRYPNGGLVLDSQGNLYGTTNGGGHNSVGIVFEISPQAPQPETVLHNFDIGVGGPCAGLVRDQNGNLYGTTCGPYGGYGTVFELSPSGTATILHQFFRGRWKKRPPDVNFPQASLIFDAEGNLYGTAPLGGNLNCTLWAQPGCGGIFEVTQSGSEKLLYAFNDGSDGGFPYHSPVIFGADGNLYGTTYHGGVPISFCQGGCGVVFELAASGAERVLYSFCQLPNCADGALPIGGLVSDPQGNLYGTTGAGGIPNANCYFGCGTVFKLDPSGAETVLYNFTGGIDGGGPDGGLIFDSKGNLYGVASGGINNCPGGYSCGVVFELSPSGTETVLYTFTGGDDGWFPNGPLVLDGQGNLYGTTAAGGAYGKGTVFKLTP